MILSNFQSIKKFIERITELLFVLITHKIQKLMTDCLKNRSTKIHIINLKPCFFY